MKYTLLKMTQLILSAMESDEVNDISDTVESLQVVDIIETVYNEFSSDYKFEEQHDFFQLEATSSSTPTVLTRPSDVVDLDWFKYDHKLASENNNDYFTMKEVSRLDFMERMAGHDVDLSNVESFNFTTNSETFPITVRNDIFPTYYMVLGDYYIICDAYDSDEETNLQKANTWCYGQIVSSFSRTNGYTPDFDPVTFAAFFNEAKSQCMMDLKKTLNQKTERKAREGKIKTQKNKRAIPTYRNYINSFPNFGRN